MSSATIDPTAPPPPPLQKETTAGNYFVSNYPPYSFWKPEFASEFLASIERPPSEQAGAHAAAGASPSPPLEERAGERRHLQPSTFNLQPSSLPLGLYVHIPFCRK